MKALANTPTRRSLGAIISLGLALLGWGAMSLAIGRLGASIVAGAMIWRWSPIRYRLGWDRQVAGRLLGFGLPLAASSVVVFASGFADQIIVGSTLGPQALGFYVLAFNLASWPVSIFSQPLRAVAPATFSALKGEPERMTRNFAKILTLLSCVAVPTCLAISGAAGPVISFVYGAAWLPAADVLLWLAAFAVLRIWFELSYDYLVVQGRSGTILLIQVLSIAVAVPAMLFAVREWGEAGVAAVQLVVGLVVAAPLYLFSLSRERIHVLAITKAVAVPLLAGVAVWVGSWMIAENVKGALLAAAAAASVAVAVIALLTLWQRDNVRLLRQSALGRTDK